MRTKAETKSASYIYSWRNGVALVTEVRLHYFKIVAGKVMNVVERRMLSVDVLIGLHFGHLHVTPPKGA
jgi:hypothetical protein